MEVPSHRPLRVCHLAKYFHPFRGGIETHVRELATAQVQSGMKVEVVCINHQRPDGSDAWSSRTAWTPTISDELDGIRIKRFGKYGTLARFDFCRGISRYIREIDKHVDLYHLHVPNPVMCVALACCKTTRPIVVTYHSDIVKQRFIRKPFSIIENKVLKNVSSILASSERYAESSSVLRKNSDRVTVVPFGLDLERFTNPSNEALQHAQRFKELAGNSPLWLCVGRLVYYKGFRTAIEALPHVPGKLMIVGQGVLQESLHELASKLGVADRIIWKDNLSDEELVGAYHAARAFWFPSILRSEAFGLVQVEAMASGCPVINCDIPGSGVPWVSLDGVSGVTVPVDDSKAFAAAANRLLDGDVRQRLSDGARNRAQTTFESSRMVKHIHCRYVELLGRSTFVHEQGSAEKSPPTQLVFESTSV